MKKSIYANVERKGDGVIVHNTLFGGIVKATCNNSMQFLDRIENEPNFDIDENAKFHQTLKELRMIVDDDVDETNLASYYYESNRKRDLFIILYVTKQCNFRCVYCSQVHENKTMSEETYNDILHVLEGYLDTHGYRRIWLSFFGGEPLLEYNAICEFSERVYEMTKRKNVEYRAGITTNGYLLTTERLKKLVSLKVTDYQITLDGLKEKHDKARVLQGKGGSWDTIVKNLTEAKSSDCAFTFMIRTNFDDEVISMSDRYIEYLSANFKDDLRFTFHFEAVKNLSGATDIDFALVDDEASCIAEITSVAKKAGLNVYTTNAVMHPLGVSCYATSGDSFAVDYDGTVLKCTVHIDSGKNKVGKINDKKIFVEDTLLANWTSFGLKEKCRSCKILPICYNKKCPLAPSDEEHCAKLTSMYENAVKMLI